MTEKLKVYFASPLFTEMEKDYNEKIVSKLRNEFGDDIDIYLPQENEAINDKSGYADSKMIAIADTKELVSSDLVIAVLDGITIDSGVASEIGIAYDKGIDIIGIYTDSRQGTFGNQQKIDALDRVAESQFSYINLYTVGLIKNAFDVHSFMLDKIDGGITKNDEEVIGVVDYFIKLKKNIYSRRDKYNPITFFYNGFVFKASYEEFDTLDEVLEDISRLMGFKDGSELIVLDDDGMSYALGDRADNIMYRTYLLNTERYDTYIVGKNKHHDYPAIVSGYHYHTANDKVNLNTEKEFHFYATDDLANSIGLGETVLVDTVRGTQKLLVTQVRESKRVDFKPTKNVIEILRNLGE